MRAPGTCPAHRDRGSQHPTTALPDKTLSIHMKLCLAPHHSQAGFDTARYRDSREWWPRCWTGRCAACPGHLHALLLRDGAAEALVLSPLGHRTSHLLLSRMRIVKYSEWDRKALQLTVLHGSLQLSLPEGFSGRMGREEHGGQHGAVLLMVTQRLSHMKNRDVLLTGYAHLQRSIPVADSLLQFLQHSIHGCRAPAQALLALQKFP